MLEFSSSAVAPVPAELLQMASLAKAQQRMAAIRAEYSGLVGDPSAAAKQRRAELGAEADEIKAQMREISKAQQQKRKGAR